MKTVILSLLAGCLVGVIYGLLKVRSPAPPVIALIGLLGILIGEHLVQMVRANMVPVQVINHHAKFKPLISVENKGSSKVETPNPDKNSSDCPH